MRVVILGAGAMGMLFGGYLSRGNDVCLIDVDPKRVEAVNANGITIREPDGSEGVYHPRAATSCEGMEPADLIVLFVKAMYSRSALGGNKAIIGPNTFVMTLQNGAGHEDILREFVAEDHIVIGTTQDNSSVLGPQQDQPRRRRPYGYRPAAGRSGGAGARRRELYRLRL